MLGVVCWPTLIGSGRGADRSAGIRSGWYGNKLIAARFVLIFKSGCVMKNNMVEMYKGALHGCMAVLRTIKGCPHCTGCSELAQVSLENMERLTKLLNKELNENGDP